MRAVGDRRENPPPNIKLNCIDLNRVSDAQRSRDTARGEKVRGKGRPPLFRPQHIEAVEVMDEDPHTFPSRSAVGFYTQAAVFPPERGNGTLLGTLAATGAGKRIENAVAKPTELR